MKKCIVIGAGMAGLTAATVLQNSAQWDVLVLDKGRGVGGRMATRRLGEGGKADHGAQYFPPNHLTLPAGTLAGKHYLSPHTGSICRAQRVNFIRVL